MKWFIISVVLFVLFTYQSIATPLQIVTLEAPPVHYKEKNVITGIATDIVKEVFARMKIPVELRIFPFARSLVVIKKGEVDAIFAIVKTVEREQYLHYPNEVLIEQSGCLFVRKDSDIAFNGEFQDMSMYTFGILRAANYGPKWQKAIDDGYITKIEETASYRLNVLKLLSNRVDVIVGPRLSMLAVIKANGYQNKIKELSPPFQVVPTYLAFSKKNVKDEIVVEFAQTLRELKADGTYDRIL